MYPFMDSISLYSIHQIVKVRHDDGRMEIVPSDSTVRFIAENLDAMNLSLPLS